ncbi:MAG: sodium:proton antiporter [Ignavibacteria bacterium]|nr:sodium:proton antiporter [Ignavibacteria bacterium]
MNIYELIAALITLTAILAFINHKFIKLPSAIGLLLASMFISFIVLILNFFGFTFLKEISVVVNSVDFNNALMGGMISFMLFAAAIHIPLDDLLPQKGPILVFSTIGIILSTFIIGTLIYYTFLLIGFNISYINCLLFGALISPTDPIAVLGVLKETKLPRSLEMKISGESLFNDGIAVVVFASLYQIAAFSQVDFSVSSTILMFLREALGGVLFGAAIGYGGYLMLKRINSYKVEVLITLAIVMGGFSIAQFLHVSGPLAMVVSGLLIGNLSKKDGWSKQTQEYLEKFWELIDEILNAVLFVWIGLEILIIHPPENFLMISVAVVLIIIVSRWLSITIPSFIIPLKEKIPQKTVAVLVWAGLRGGLSLAMALSLSSAMDRDLFIYLTYIVVIFTIVVQGLTLKKIVSKVFI